MHCTIQNGLISLTADTLGAQMLSIQGESGLEYLWQGDPAFWGDRAPVLFPFIARLEKEQYTALGTPYHIGIHGFAAQSEFCITEQTESSLTLTLNSSPETLAQYPFPFSLRITYRLEGRQVVIENRVKNAGDGPMFFALGNHPGFRVPLAENESFTDYSLVFSTPCQPDRIGFTEDTILVNGQTEPYPLADDRRIDLHHALFDNDAIILQNMAREISLVSRKSGRGVTVTYPDMPYLGIWHWPKKPAPYVCIEPWSSLPGRSQRTEEISCRSDFIRLPAGNTWESTWQISLF